MPAITDSDRNLIRRKVGDTAESVWSDAEIDATWAEYANDYTSSRLVRAAVVLELFDELLINHARMVTYRQNQARVNASDIFKHIKQLRDQAADKLDELVKSTSGTMKIATTRRKPTRLKDMPDA